MGDIIGRKREITQLNKVVSSKNAEFAVIYGRRRVGKTYLIREYFNQTFDFELTGLANANTSQQLVNFHTALQRQSKNPSDQLPTNWFEAFQQLIDHLISIKTSSKRVVFLDELPWMDTSRSDFVMALEHFWNSWADKQKDVVLIGCGSAASWMINKLVNNHGGLHNRITERIKLLPFDLQETELLLKSNNNVLDRYQILQIYMVMGGIPFYLNKISPDKSAAQNIEELCFRKGALLASEFKNLFVSLFKNATRHEQVVTALSSRTLGMTRKELVKATKMSTGGGLTRLLFELEESGFIGSYIPFNKKSRDTIYQLTDFYSSFYLKFIKSNTNYDSGVWTNAIDNPTQRAWAGFAFERVCQAHTFQIKKALGIHGILSSTSSWRSTKLKNGAQIDLVIDRRDQVISLCEMKYSISPFKITSSYNENLRNKVATFKEETKTRKALFLTMITTFGLHKNKYSSSLVQNDLTMDALFD